MQIHWLTEVSRSALERLYWRFYKFAPDATGTWKQLTSDVYNDAAIRSGKKDGKYDENEHYPHEKFRRWPVGIVNKKTGEETFTTPSPANRELITDHLDREGFLHRVSLHSHKESEEAGWLMAQQLGYDKMADQHIIGGTFRGMFLGEAKTKDKIYSIVLHLHYLPNGRLFRVRKIVAVFERAALEALSAFLIRSRLDRPDQIVILDGFAAFGTNYGGAFLLRSSNCLIDELKFDSFEFDKTGRRAVQFSATTELERLKSVRFHLCDDPERIDRAHKLLDFADAAFDTSFSGGTAH